MCLDHFGTMPGVYGAYVGPMLIHVRLLDAMLWPYSGHVELMLSQKWRVPLNLKRNTPFLDHVGTMSGVYGAYVGPMLIHAGLLDAMLGHIRAVLSLC